ncbi:jasmonate-zim-domain protein 10 [Arabidopsis thaliana]|uniref:Protein TIFY n=2 Tax=Arabidopsis TaxID=3701 RepID=A0A1P8BCH9_ARATH|nr:jasmonate-zim-domain protein 10 [Arabidopsis thaliana]ANM69302.1 jasmonate-zim-domain protein 10 [Arabidopsis thaliana]|eukprot:NP_001330994.1 jasmonate-zim-domain protein 10 [Arabidopsis thaliana]
MSKATIELDFLGLEKKQTNNAPKPKFQKFLDRRRSFRDIQGAISKIDPEIIKSLLASTGNNSDSSAKSRSVPSTPREDQPQIPISPVHASLARYFCLSGKVFFFFLTFLALPEKTKKFEIQIFKTFIFLRSSTELVSGTVPMTIFYNGSVSVFQVSRNKAGEIMKVANEAASKKDESSMETDLSVILPTTLRPKLFGQNLEGDLPIARRKSLQRFLEKRKER